MTPGSDGFDPNVPDRILAEELMALGFHLIGAAQDGGWLVRASISDPRLRAYHAAPSDSRISVVRRARKLTEATIDEAPPTDTPTPHQPPSR